MAYNDEYSVLRQKITSLRCSPDILSSLKEIFSSSINSKREMEFIGNLSDLISILEKRYHLHRDNIEVFKIIAENLQRHDLKNLIRNYGYVQHIVPEISHGVSNNNPEISPIFLPIHPDLKQRVYDKIRSEIGTRWKEFARYLNIKEGQIDQLNLKYSTVDESTLEVLKYHERICEPHKLRTALCNALSAARRNDLKIEVEHIFDTHHLMSFA
ncbi:unnamed protein product [Brassicogethes aeneus]|uniref:Death domain-containing protein n=1 Tax=Brassicogethes aeneus TaxID=1431903 RepID=A0A9P0B6U1_BRAAE|nr:unnamed protein product [Brassicogethes aeneus]